MEVSRGVRNSPDLKPCSTGGVVGGARAEETSSWVLGPAVPLREAVTLNNPLAPLSLFSRL